VNTQRTDFLVGLFILVTVGIVVGLAIVTSGLGERRTVFYLRTPSADALSQDTRVVLRGLDVGRVRDISPVVDTGAGSLAFVARLSVRERFSNGTELRLPLGTTAEIVQPTPIAAAVVDLMLPDVSRGRGYLEPGDTIIATRPQGVLDALASMASDLRGEIQSTLEDTRSLLRRTTVAVEDTRQLMADNGPVVHEVLQRLSANLARSDQLLADVGPRIGPLNDSLVGTLSDARRTLAGADSMLRLVGSIAAENRTYAHDIAERLLRTAVVLEHFSDQISRRPARLLTGVTPPPLDTVRPPRPDSGGSQDSTRGRL
jgi:ABC-type transporter Mla subunit MlaD